MNSRNYSIDIIRALGVLLIILAHCLIPDTLLNIRTFDVTILVMAAGMSAALSKKANESYCKYVWKRFRKLVLPTWFIVTLVVVAELAICAFLAIEPFYNLKMILETYTFVGGFGYVWIVRIYLILAIANPLLLGIEQKITNNYLFCLVLSGFFGVHYLLKTAIGDFNLYISSYVLYFFPYAVAYLVGIRVIRNKSSLKSLLFLSAVAFLIMQILQIAPGGGFTPAEDKYPPGLYYISYGIVTGLVIYVLAEKCKTVNVRIEIVIRWLSKNSYRIYLCHILPIIALNWLNTYFVKINSGTLIRTIITFWPFQYFFALLVAIALTVAWNKEKHLNKL